MLDYYAQHIEGFGNIKSHEVLEEVLVDLTTDLHKEIGQAGLLVQVGGQVDQHLLQHLLHAGGAVGEPAALVGLQVDRLVPVAGRPEELDEA